MTWHWLETKYQWKSHLEGKEIQHQENIVNKPKSTFQTKELREKDSYMYLPCVKIKIHRNQMVEENF